MLLNTNLIWISVIIWVKDLFFRSYHIIQKTDRLLYDMYYKNLDWLIYKDENMRSGYLITLITYILT